MSKILMARRKHRSTESDKWMQICDKHMVKPLTLTDCILIKADGSMTQVTFESLRGNMKASVLYLHNVTFRDMEGEHECAKLLRERLKPMPPINALRKNRFHARFMKDMTQKVAFKPCFDYAHLQIVSGSTEMASRSIDLWVHNQDLIITCDLEFKTDWLRSIDSTYQTNKMWEEQKDLLDKLRKDYDVKNFQNDS